MAGSYEGGKTIRETWCDFIESSQEPCEVDTVDIWYFPDEEIEAQRC